MATGFFSLPTELICHILTLLEPRDINRCSMACNTFRIAVWNSVAIQYKLESHAQGLIGTEIATMNSISVARKMHSLKKLASLWRSDFHAHTIFETAVNVVTHVPFACIPNQSVKCGFWWMNLPMYRYCIQECSTSAKLSQTWSANNLYRQHMEPGFIAFDPLQDLMAIFSFTLPTDDYGVTVTDAGQDHHVCSVEFRLASSQRPHPHAVCASLECKHTFDAPGYYRARFPWKPKICGDRVFVFYYTEGTPMDSAFIQVINWRKGYANSHFLCQPHYGRDHFHVVDERKIVFIGSKGLIYLYTLQGLDGLPQRRITYHLPKNCHFYWGNIDVYVQPSFHSKVAHPELMPNYIPSLETQIMVLECHTIRPAILVTDMAIFSDTALHSDMPVEIPWSDWGPQHTYCFLHDNTHHISVFGSKMAIALPQDRIPDPGERLEQLSTQGNGHFYVHIWDFNKRLIARSESINDPDSPDLLTRRPVMMTDPWGEDIFSNHAYTAIVCRTPFPTYDSTSLFLEQDRLTVTWAPNSDINIQVISPVQTEVGPDPTDQVFWLPKVAK